MASADNITVKIEVKASDLVDACIKAIIEDGTLTEVVRCKDCKYGHRLTDANGYNYRTCNYPWGHGMMVDEYGFCKWGERRMENAEVR